jgi:hypothetical protein
MSLEIQYNFSSNYVKNNIVQNIGDAANLNCTLYNNPSIGQESAPNNTNKSIYMNGSNKQYGLIAPYTSNNNGMTFSVWFKATQQNTTWSRIFDWGNGAGSNNIILYINNGYLGFSVYWNQPNPPNPAYVRYQVDNVIPNVLNNQWNHVVWVLNGTWPNGWTIYFNGSLFTTYNQGWYPPAIERTNNYIGRSNWSIDPPFWGNICDFRFYNTMLNSVQAQGVYYGLDIFIGTFAYQGCYNDEIPRAIPTQVQNITTPKQCKQLAYDNNAQIFGVQYGGQCFIGNSLESAKKYGVKSGNCGTLGGFSTNQVYYSSTSTTPAPPPPPPPTPSLSLTNFSTEYFSNNNKNNKNIFAMIVFFIIFIIILIIIRNIV